MLEMIIRWGQECIRGSLKKTIRLLWNELDWNYKYLTFVIRLHNPDYIKSVITQRWSACVFTSSAMCTQHSLPSLLTPHLYKNTTFTCLYRKTHCYPKLRSFQCRHWSRKAIKIRVAVSWIKRGDNGDVLKNRVTTLCMVYITVKHKNNYGHVFKWPWQTDIQMATAHGWDFVLKNVLVSSWTRGK